MVPIYLTRPHKCLFYNLKFVEQLYHMRLMDHDLYTKWMSANGGFYQLGISPACMRLWEEFTKFKCSRGLEDMGRKVVLGKSGAIAVDYCTRHDGAYLTINWDRVRKRDDISALNDIWRWSSDADHTKTNVSAKDLIWHMARYPEIRRRFNRWRHLFSINLYNVTVSALLIHIIGNPVADKVFELLHKHGYCCLTMSDYSSLLKHLSVALRRTGKWPDGKDATLSEVTGCAGWELAIGRSKNVSDWKEESRKRTAERVDLGTIGQPVRNKETNDLYLRELEPILDDIMAELVRQPGRRVSWREFVTNRQTWVSSGSTGGKKMKLNDGTEVRLNKHAYYETLKVEDMLPWLEQEPEMVARASEKYEMGKARAIYGTDVVDYAIASYALDKIEEFLYNVNGVESGLTGLDQQTAMIRRARIVEDEKVECTMIDYADFNYQHTLEAQSLVFRCLAKRLSVVGHHPDKVKAAEWIADALLNQWCYFPGPKSPKRKVTQGMFSGCRGTNFKNTLLNLAYFRHSVWTVGRDLGLFPRELHNIHQGDDVWISNKSRLWAIAITQTLVGMGLVLQPSKQMFDIGRGEFLRVVYTRQGCQGYSARAVGTLIMKPLQGADVVSPAERAVALNSQIMILHRRGFSEEGCRLLWAAIVPYAARATLPNGALSLPSSFIKKSYLDNGLDLGPPKTACPRSMVVPPIPVIVFSSPMMELSIPSHMSRDWARLISEQVQTAIKYDELVKRMHAANMGDSLRTIDKQRAIRGMEDDLREWLTKYPSHSVNRNSQEYERLGKGPLTHQTFRSFLNTIASNILPKAYRGHPPTMLSSIMRAVSASPFKSITNAMTATGQSMIPATYTAIAACPNGRASSAAATGLTNLRSRFDDPSVVKILDGLRAGATKYECEFHPNLLSWLQGIAVDDALKEAMILGTGSRFDVMAMVADKFDEYIRTIRTHPIFEQISRY